MTTQQKPPKGDARYRVHSSIRVYLAKLECGTGGCTWFINDSIERVMHRDAAGNIFVSYMDRMYPVQSAKKLKKLIKSQLKYGSGAQIGGKHIGALNNEFTFKAHPFIDISSVEDTAFYNKCRSAAGRPRVPSTSNAVETNSNDG